MKFVYDPKYTVDAWLIVRNLMIDRIVCTALVLFPLTITLLMLGMSFLWIIPLVFTLLFVGVFLNAEIKSRKAKKKPEIQRFLAQLNSWFEDTTGGVADQKTLRKLLDKNEEFTIHGYSFIRSVGEDFVVIFAKKALSDTTSVNSLAQNRRQQLRQKFPDARIFM